jgi:hypothetical protein
MTTPTNTDDLIDSRDVIARIAELEDTLADLECDRDNAELAVEEAEGDSIPEAHAKLGDALEALEDWKEGEESSELFALRLLAEEAAGYAPDWKYGATLIRDSYFKKYAQEFASDCGLLDGTACWPATCIDWDEAARELQHDYTAVEFDGVTYWVR